MVAYVDWTYYSTIYLGTVIAQANFPALALRATAQINELTFGRAGSVIEADEDDGTIDLIKLATCAVADELKRQTDVGGLDGIQSERVGNHSVTYFAGASATRTAEEKIDQVARIYLAQTGLMFRGFGADEYAG